MPTIEVFADVCCPFTHVGLLRLVAERSRRGVDAPLVVRAWPLELVNGAPLDRDLIAHEVEAIRQQVAPDLFVGFDPTAFPASSLPAMELTARARRSGVAVAEQVALAVRRALFEDGRDVADPAVLGEIAAAHGLDPAGADGADSADDEAAVLADWHEGKVRGVIGSPHFLVAGEGFFCPGLDISHHDGAFAIAPDAESFARFTERALGGDAA